MGISQTTRSIYISNQRNKAYTTAKRGSTLLILLILVPICGLSNPFDYIFPNNATAYHKCETQIIVRPGWQIDDTDLALLSNAFISGSESGDISYSIMLLEDRQVALFKPNRFFLPGETVHVSFSGKFDYLLEFTIEDVNSTELPPDHWSESEDFSLQKPPESSVLSEFPEAIVTQNGETGEGYIYGTSIFNGDNVYILEDTGIPVFVESTDKTTAFNFRYINDTMCIYAHLNDQNYVGVDTNFQVIDTFQCVNGYTTDFHEMLMTESGNAILMSYDVQVIDLSEIINGGNPNARVTGLVLQEIDPNDNLVFQWRSWDHFEITDALYDSNDTIDLTAPSISYVHCNSIEIDDDTNWIISSRHMSEVTKINRKTGDIIWRLGGKNNQFTFINDSLDGFNLQHDARRTPTGTLTIFDNGLFHSTPVTRVVEYIIDEFEMTATMVWEFRNPYGDITQVTGNAQRLSNGNTFISWGRRTTVPNPTDFIIEVDSLGEIVYELGFVNPDEMGWIYRAYRLPYKQEGDVTSVSQAPPPASRLRLYPNPAFETTKVSFFPDHGGNYTLSIHSVNGDLIQSINYHLAKGLLFETSISLQAIPSGMYVMRLISPQGQRITSKFIKVE